MTLGSSEVSVINELMWSLSMVSGWWTHFLPYNESIPTPLLSAFRYIASSLFSVQFCLNFIFVLVNFLDFSNLKRESDVIALSMFSCPTHSPGPL